MPTEVYDFSKFKKRWREICGDPSYDMPIYHKDWYWDACCEGRDEWDIIIYEDENAIAAFPFMRFQKLGLWRIENPWAVPRGGLWLHYKKSGLSDRKLCALNAVISQYVIDRLPPFDHFKIKFQSEYKDALTFLSNGFRLNVAYNQYIENKTVEEIRAACYNSRKRHIDAGIGKYKITTNSIDIDAVCDFFFRNFEEKQAVPLYRKEQLRRLLEEMIQRDAARILCAYQEDILTAVSVFLIDEKSVYHQFCSHIKDCGDGNSLLVYRGIEYAMLTNRRFDFEGSSIESVASFNKSFGAAQEMLPIPEKATIKYDIFSCLKRMLGRQS